MDRGIVVGGMSKVLTAKYDAQHNVLQLTEPLEDVSDAEDVEVVVRKTATAESRASWRALENSLPKEQGEDLSRAIEELFPPWND